MAAFRMHCIWFTLFCVVAYTNSFTKAFTAPDGYSNCSTLVFVETLVEELADLSEPDPEPYDWHAQTCKKNNLFPCTNGNSCIPLINVCNGVDDCGDQSDEQCSQKVNINGTLWGTIANAYEDIKEMVQEKSSTDNKPTASIQCTGDKLLCGNHHSCIHSSLRCDGVNNCGDGSDEEGCPKRTNGNEFEPKNTQLMLMENECLYSTPKFQGIGCLVTGTTFKENTYVRNCNGAAYDREYILLKYLTQVEENITVVSKCKDGFTRNGYLDPIFRSKCQHGIWTPSIPACQTTCELFYMSDLNVECSRNNEKIDCREPFLPETTIVYSCKSNDNDNARKVTQKLKCLFSGKWDSNLPDCTPYNPPVPTSVSPSPRYGPTKPSPPRGPTTLSAAETVITEIEQRCQDYSNFTFNTKASPLLKSTATCARCQGIMFKGSGNVPVDNHKFPHMALLGYTDLYGYKEWFCDASLISEKYVLSTADCKQTEKGKADWVKLGHPTILNHIFRVVSVIVHPAYNPLYAYNNIALFRFRGIKRYNLVVQPICLYTSYYIQPSDKLIATSFVPVAETPEKPSNASMHLNDVECTRSFNKDKRFSKGYEYQTSLCALPSTWTNNTQSGSPLHVTIPNMKNIWALVGISSVSPNLEDTNNQQPQPIVYIKISFYLHWIAKTVWPKRAETNYYTVGP